MKKDIVAVKSSCRKEEPPRPGSVARRMLEVLGITRAYVRAIGTQEEDIIRADLPMNHSNWKPIEAALLEAERQRARAITHTRRRQVI